MSDGRSNDVDSTDEDGRFAAEWIVVFNTHGMVEGMAAGA